jgi:hypothetical protein
MGQSFLLRFQEAQVFPDQAVGSAGMQTGTKIQGEQPDRAAYSEYDAMTNPRRDMETATGVPSERPDHSAAGEACSALPARGATDTLTLTYVGDEAPRNDDLRRHSATVLPVTTETKTAIRGERPDRAASGESCAAMPERSAGDVVSSTLTYTFVNAEQPRKDERRRSALVLPACS